MHLDLSNVIAPLETMGSLLSVKSLLIIFRILVQYYNR